MVTSLSVGPLNPVTSQLLLFAFFPVATREHHDESALLPMVSGPVVVRCVTFNSSRVMVFFEIVTIIHLGAAVSVAAPLDSEESSVLLDVAV
jgi:hypothetical protein